MSFADQLKTPKATVPGSTPKSPAFQTPEARRRASVAGYVHRNELEGSTPFSSSSSSAQPRTFHSAGRQEHLEARSSQGRTEEELLRQTQSTLLQCDEIATGALGTLNNQSDQLDRIQADSDSIGHNLNVSEKLLNRMTPVWRPVTNGVRSLFGRPLKGESSSSSSAVPSTPTSSAAPNATEARGGYNAAAGKPRDAAATGGGYMGRRHSMPASNTAAAAAVARANGSSQRPPEPTSETEKLYGNIDSILDGLKHKTEVMNQTIGQQNEMLDHITSEVGNHQDRMRKQNEKMRGIIAS